MLLIEDDGLIRLTATGMLAGLGHTVLNAGNALRAEATTLLGSEAIDVLLTDINLPGRSGDELATMLYKRLPSCGLYLPSPTTALTDHIYRERDLSAQPYSEEGLAQAEALSG